MRLSTKGRYAVMAMADLARRQADDRAVALADIAERQQISLSYLEQLFARLRRAGLVRSVRGPGGGYLLGRAAESIAIADIVQAVEESQRPLAAANAPAAEAPADARGLTQTLWEGLGNQVRAYLSGISLAEVVGQGRRNGANGGAEKRSAA